MSNKKFCAQLMAFVAMSFFNPSLSFAQKAFTPKIQTPETSQDLKDSSVQSEDSEVEDKESPKPVSGSAAPRRLQQHGLGFGLGQTFLLGDYDNYGNDKITFDLFYSYAASYSFDLLLNAHWSKHEDENEAMRVMGLAASIKGRVVEFDNLSPYFLGGLGFYAPQAKREINGTTQWSDQKVTFGLNFGGGIDLRLNDEYVVGVLGQMHWPFRLEQSDQPDLKGYYFKLLITGMYLF